MVHWLSNIKKFEKYLVKFLKAELIGNFIWPQNSWIKLVDPKFIFYGPIELINCGQFKINQSDYLKMYNLYKEIKIIINNVIIVISAWSLFDLNTIINYCLSYNLFLLLCCINH